MTHNERDLSSAGRASALQAGGHRFEPCRSHFYEYHRVLKILIPQNRLYLNYGEIAQLARAHGSYPWCRGFESPSRYSFVFSCEAKGYEVTFTTLHSLSCIIKFYFTKKLPRICEYSREFLT